MFELSPWKNTGGYVLKGSSVDEAQMLLDDRTSRYTMLTLTLAFGLHAPALLSKRIVTLPNVSSLVRQFIAVVCFH